jgi:competence ComEA-like helix-hairpin-helix protein
MNLQPSNRRQDLPVRLGNHGYQLDGDYAVLNAELHVPPYFSDSSFGLELWACSAPLSSGAPEGVKIAEVSLDLPTPIGPHVQQVEARAAIHPPAGSGDHSMVLVLVGGSGDARRVHDFANYGRLQHFANPELGGAVAYAIEGDDVVLSATSVVNPRSEGNSSGTLCLELWASSEPYAGGAPRGHRLAGTELGSIWGQFNLPEVSRRVAFSAPPSGRWHVSLLLREWTPASGFETRDHRNFDAVYVQPTLGSAALPANPAAAAPRSGDKLRLIKPTSETALEAPAVAKPVVVAPAAEAVVALAAEALVAPAAEALVAPAAEAVVAPAAEAVVAPAAEALVAPASTVVAAPAAAPAISGREASKVSVQTASIEELAKLPGLSLKIAKEIVKNRPFASVDALVDVRGIGEKTLRRIKSLLTL